MIKIIMEMERACLQECDEVRDELAEARAEIAVLTARLEVTEEELAQRREHMRRGIEPGRPTGGVG